MKARIIDFAVGMDKKQRVTFALDGDFRETFDELHEGDVELTVKKYRQKRSLDANAYAWVLIGKIAEKTRITREDVYRHAIWNVGGGSETVCVKDAAVPRLIDGWRHNGLGWFTDTFKSKIDGCTNVTLYYGSSAYDTKQMSDLIDGLVAEAKELGIETLTPEQLAAMSAEWK